MTMHEQRITSAPSLSPEWIERAKAGDQEAYTELYRQTSPALYRTIRSMVRDEDLAWDIQQNTYIRAFRALDKLENPAAFLPWLRRIAVNETATVMAKTQPLTFTELADENGEPPQFAETREAYQPELNLDRQETARLVREILETLPREQQLIVGMFYYEGLSIQEISEALHIAPGTVKAQLYRGRKRIEAGVLDLEKQGVKLYGLAPLPFLLALLRGIEPAAGMEARTLASVLAGIGKANAATAAASAAGTAGQAAASAAGGAAGGNGGPAIVAAKAAKTGFLHSLAGKIVLGLAALALIGGGITTFALLRNHNSKGTGDALPPSPPQVTQDGSQSGGQPTPAYNPSGSDGDVLFDKDNVKVTVDSLQTEGACSIQFSVENHSGDSICLDFEHVAVNGCMVYCLAETYYSIPDGESSTALFSISQEDLDLYGIREISQISGDLEIKEWIREEILYSEPIVLKTANWSGEPVFDESGRLVYDKDGVKIYTDRVEGNDGSSVPVLYMTVINRSDHTFELEDQFSFTTVNRFRCEPIIGGFPLVSPGNCGIVTLQLDDQDLERFHIKAFNDVEMGFALRKPGTLDYYDKSEPGNIWTNPDPLPDVPYDPEDSTLVLDQKGVKIVALGWKREERYNNFLLEFYVENHFGDSVILEFDDLTVNGISIYNGDEYYLMDNDRSYNYVVVWENNLKEAGIETVSEISFRVEVEKSLSYATIVKSGIVTIPIHEGE